MIKEQPMGWLTTWTTDPGEPPGRHETIVDADPVDLDSLELPVCDKCGEETELELVGICANPTKPYYAPTWFCLEPVCSVCKHVVPWDHPRIFPGEEEGTAWTPVIRQQ